MQTDFLLIGQGISGTFLSWELKKAGKSFIIIDDAQPSAASKVASGIINPITGRRMVKTWMIDELLPHAFDAYREIGAFLGIECITQTDSLDFFPTAQMRLAFLERYATDPQYLSLPADENDQMMQLNYGLGYGIISPCFLVDLQSLLPAYRTSIETSLIQEPFERSQLRIEDNSVFYKNIKADKVIFCDGKSSFDHPYFSRLPFALSKGEALIAAIPDLDRSKIYKKGISIVPWKQDLFWIGSSYEWEFENDLPTTDFRERVTAQLKELLKTPFTITDHLASLRPGTLERRPFTGWHPNQPHIGIFNGMGTKGCSLAPYFARQFVRSITNDTAILAEADIKRFTRILSR
ncbi:MAG: FAD-binding oxidoreductase [Chitinophagaceae bacterium]|nr:FAD-binding oxidoreductase [Chitinophagaceae bacterium]